MPPIKAALPLMLSVLAILMPAAWARPAAPLPAATLVLHAGRAGARISPTLFGLMFEDINHAGDGGVYAELLPNRILLDEAGGPAGWAAITSGRARGAADIDASQPVSHTVLSMSLRLAISRVGAGERVGITSDGFYGIPVRPATTYRVSFYAKGGPDFGGPLTASLESTAGRVYAAATLPGITHVWRRYALTLTTLAGIVPSQTNRFVIAASHTGTVWFTLLSLFPPTWHDRPNGLRVDLMQLLSAMRPGFLRFPGGNFLEGQTAATRFAWRQTLGDLGQRPGHPNDAWGYRSSDGLGLLEYLQWCEDLHMAPVLAVYAGYSLGGEHVPAGAALRPYVRDALDEIEYVSGSTHTVWGARRAADGHPAPFALPYVEIGNEDFFDQSGSYDSRFTQFSDAMKRRYPATALIATAPVSSRTPDLYDQHFYEKPAWFVANAGYYDGYDRRAPKILVGEYAAQTDTVGQSQATLGAALGEAAWMTGLERNADVVRMASYAPLFANDNLSQWNPDLIGFDSLTSYGSPSYYVQKLFSVNHGDMVIPSTLHGDGLTAVASKDSCAGTMYVTVVNTGPRPRPTRIVVDGGHVAARGTVTVLAGGSPDDQNSLGAPTRVVPTTRALAGLSASFTFTFPRFSTTVIRLARGGESCRAP